MMIVTWLYTACTLAIGYMGLSSFVARGIVRQFLTTYSTTGTTTGMIPSSSSSKTPVAFGTDELMLPAQSSLAHPTQSRARSRSRSQSQSQSRRRKYPDDPDLDEYGDNVHSMNNSLTMGIMTSVSHEEYTQTAQEALQDIELLWRSVDTTCTLHVSRRDVPKSETERKERNIPRDHISKLAKRLDEFTFDFSEVPDDQADATMRLCRVNGERDPTKTAILTLASDIRYLKRDLTALPAFLNKMTYAEKTNTTLYLFLGSLDEHIIRERPGLPWNSKCSAQEGNSNHFLKPIAFLSLLERTEPRHEWIFFMDADAWFNDGAFYRHDEEGMHIDSYFNLTSNPISLVGSQNRFTWYLEEKSYTPIILNGGLLGLRNDEWSRQFSALWWRSRCGFKDQLGLWSILLAYWSSEVDRIRRSRGSSQAQADQVDDDEMANFVFEFDKSAFDNYTNTHYVYQHLMHNANKIRAATGIDEANDNDGGFFYKKTGFLATGVPLELPRVMVLPTSSVNDLPALFSQSDPEKFGPKDTFICHQKLFEKKAAKLRTTHCHERKICSSGKCGKYYIR